MALVDTKPNPNPQLSGSILPSTSPGVPPAPPKEPEPEGAATLLIGGPGGGKSYSLSTLIECGLELFVIGTEPRYKESLMDSMAARKLSLERLHYASIAPMAPGWASLIDSAKLINTLNFESLAQIKSGIGKDKYDQYVKLLTCLSNFVDERTGQAFGPVDSWGPDRALAIDSLSGVNLMAMDLVVGSKPVRAMGEWGVAMDNEERLINMLCSSTKCFFVLTAHVDREPNEITGGVTIQVGALGRKLAPKLPRFFSEVVHCYREGDKYYWSTVTPMYELKRRVLPLTDKIEPTFKPIVDAWKARLAQQKAGAL